MKQTDIKYGIPTQPRQLRLDITTRCNARCLSCHRFLSKRSGEMSVGFITDILNDVSRWQEHLFEIVPTNYGEFFLREDWHLILTLITQKLPKTRITLPTNGSMLDPDTVSELCKFRKLEFLNISVNAFFEDTYEHFTGLPASNLQKIAQATQQITILRPDITLSMSMVFDPEYQTDLERDHFCHYWQHYIPQLLPAASCNRPSKKPVYPVKVPCRSIYSDIVIGYDKKLSSCCFDSDMKLDLGYYSGDLKADWQNEKITELRRMHNEGKRDEIEWCKGCTFA